MKKRIFVVSRFFAPEPGAAAERIRFFVAALADKAHVTVLTTMPSYPQFRTVPAYRWKFFVKESAHGATIYRIWTPQWGKRFVARLFSDLWFVCAGVFFSCFLRSQDKVFISSPPFFQSFIGLFWRYIRRTPYVLDVRDLYPDSLIEIGFLKRGMLCSFFLFLEKRFYAGALFIVTVSDWCKQRILQKTSTETLVMMNGLDVARFDAGKATPDIDLFEDGCQYAVYTGNLGRVYDFDLLLDAAKQLQQTHPSLRWLFIGDGWQRTHIEARIAKESIDTVRCIPSQPIDVIPGILRRADIGLIAVNNPRLTQGSIPVKVFEYLAAELPVFARITGESKIVFGDTVVYVDSADDLARAIEAHDFSLSHTAGRALVTSTYDRKQLVKPIIDRLLS